ncbi:MAG: glycosyltransferase family 4 protein [Rhodobacteraceae bacterium]|nr:glycosyltransferase family 4 protein [Paracoccaceae bacterium]
MTVDGEKNVLFLGLQTYSRFGGIQRFNQRLVSALLSVVGPDRLTAHFTQDAPTDIPSDMSICVTGFGRKKISYIYQSLKKSLSADTLILGHINLLWLGRLAKLVHPKLNIIMMAHGVEVWNDPAFRKIRFYEPYLLRKLDRIAAVSAYTAGVMQREFHLPEALFTIFPNTVNPEVDAEHHPSAPPFALAVSRMDEHDRTKHLDQIIRAMKLLPDHLSQTRLVIVGDGVLRPDYEALVAENGLTERVEFAGRVSEERLLELYQTATQFVLPSSKEGFGIVYLEAWSHLLPVICSVHGAAPEVVSDGVDGYAVEPTDTEALATAMARLFDEPDLAADMGRKGAEKMRRSYTTDTLNRNVAALLAKRSAQ